MKLVLFLFIFCISTLAQACPPNQPEALAISNSENIADQACLQLRAQPQCQDLYKQITKEHQGDPDFNIEQYAPNCNSQSIGDRGLQALQVDKECAFGALKSLGDMIGSGLGWVATYNIRQTIAAECDSNPGSKRQIYSQANAENPVLLRLPIPTDAQVANKTCAEITNNVLPQALEAKAQGALKNIHQREEFHQPLTADESALKNWYHDQHLSLLEKLYQKKDAIDRYLDSQGIELNCYNLQKRAAITCGATSDLVQLATGVTVAAKALMAAKKAAGLFFAKEAVKDATKVGQSADTLKTGTEVVSKPAPPSSAAPASAATGGTPNRTPASTGDTTPPSSETLAKARVSSERRTASIPEPTVEALYGTRGATVELTGTPKSIRVWTSQKPDGSTGLMMDQAVKDVSTGKVITVVNELPVDKLTGFIDARSQTGERFFNAVLSDSQAGQKTVVSIDINNVKLVNDTFQKGAEAGNAYIQNIAKAIRNVVGDKVPIGRNGGDEIILVLENKSPQEVKTILQKIQDATHNSEVHATFREESIAQAQKFKAQKAAIDSDAVMTSEEKATALGKLTADFKTYVTGSQEGISMGSVNVAPGEKTLADVLPVADDQGKVMKIANKQAWNQSTLKYGGTDAVPGQRSNLSFRPKISEPAADVGGVKPAAPVLDLSSSTSVAKEVPVQSLFRFNDVQIVSFRNAAGEEVLRDVKFTKDAAGHSLMSTEEVFLNKNTGLIDGANPRGARILEEFQKSSVPGVQNAIVGVRVDGLKYINYFKDGSVSGDQVLAAVGNVIKRTADTEGIAFKMRGSDFAVALKDVPPANIAKFEQRLSAAIAKDPAVRQVFEEQKRYVQAQIRTTPLADADKIKKLNESLISIDKLSHEFSVRSESLSSSESIIQTLSRVNP